MEDTVIVNPDEFVRMLKAPPFHYVRHPRKMGRKTVCDMCLLGLHACADEKCPCLCKRDS